MLVYVCIPIVYMETHICVKVYTWKQVSRNNSYTFCTLIYSVFLFWFISSKNVFDMLSQFYSSVICSSKNPTDLEKMFHYKMMKSWKRVYLLTVTWPLVGTFQNLDALVKFTYSKYFYLREERRPLSCEIKRIKLCYCFTHGNWYMDIKTGSWQNQGKKTYVGVKHPAELQTGKNKPKMKNLIKC